jgi:hypothetical protein
LDFCWRGRKTKGKIRKYIKIFFCPEYSTTVRKSSHKYIYVITCSVAYADGSVYKDHTFNKETAHISHEFSQYNTST